MRARRSYFEDFALFPNKATGVWSLLLLIFLLLLPWMVKPYQLTVFQLVALNVIVALGLNILVGNTGQISLGHAGFVAVGAYCCAFLLQAGVPFVATVLLSGLVSAALGALLGVPSLRLEGPYLAIATLAFGLSIMVIIGRLSFFGGRMGMSVPRLDLSWAGMRYDRALYYVFLVITLAMTLGARNLLKSRIGRAFQAIRDSDIAASVTGIHLAGYKTLSFAVSAFYAGVAGCLWALYLQFVTPGAFNFMMSIMFLAMVVLGGLGSITGSVLGGIAMTYLTLRLDKIVEVPFIGPALESFSRQFMSPSGLPSVKWVITGLILIAVVLFEPLGLAGIWMRIKRYWRYWPF